MGTRHRLSTIVNADHVVVINNGEIVEQGRHSELIRNKGYYHRLCVRQGFIIPEEPQKDLAEPVGRGFNSEAISVGNSTRNMLSAGDPRMSGNDSAEANMKFSRSLPKATCQEYQNRNSLRNHLKPDAPEFIPQAYQTGNNRSPSPGKMNTGLSDKQTQPDHSGLDYDTETDESFRIETGSVEEGSAGSRVASDSLLTTILKSQDGINRMNAASVESRRRAETPVPRTEIESNSPNHGAGDSAFARIEGPVDLPTPKQGVLRRRLSKSEPLGTTKQAEDTPECSTNSVAKEVTARTNQSKTSANPRRRRRKNSRKERGGKASHSQSSTDRTGP